MKSLQCESNVVKERTPKIEVSVPYLETYPAYTYYLGGVSIHVCTQ